MKGRPPKPTAQHHLAGTFRSDRHAGRADQWLGGSTPEKPVDLSSEESAVWDGIAAHVPAEALSAADAPQLEIACWCWARWRRLRESDDRKNFYMAIAAAKQFDSIVSRFGCTPADRAKLRLPAAPDNAVEFVQPLQVRRA